MHLLYIGLIHIAEFRPSEAACDCLMHLNTKEQKATEAVTELRLLNKSEKGSVDQSRNLLF